MRISGLLTEVEVGGALRSTPTSPRQTETTRYALLADVESSLHAAISARHAHLGGPGTQALTLELTGWHEVEAKVSIAVDHDDLILGGGTEHGATGRGEVDVQRQASGQTGARDRE